MNFIYLFFKPLKQKNKVTFVSRQSNTETLDFRMLRENIENNSSLQVDVLCKKLDKGVGNTFGYFLHMFSQMHSFATSKVIVTDSYCILLSILRHKKNTACIQTWHALSAVKKFGCETVGREDGSSEVVATEMKMHHNYDYVLCSSDVTAEYFCKGFGCTKDKITKIGLPRIDYINQRKPDIRKAIFRKYPELEDKNKKNIIYVPTMRRGRGVDVNGIIDRLDFNRFNLVVRLHPLEIDNESYEKREGVIYDNDFLSYDMLEVADIVISDYSSFVVESSLRDIPLFLYIYDVNEYGKYNGLNMDFESEAIGKYAFRNCDEMISSFDSAYDMDALRIFRKKYVDIDMADCTKQLSEFIERLVYEN